jgi:hypothetical protein
MMPVEGTWRSGRWHRDRSPNLGHRREGRHRPGRATIAEPAKQGKNPNDNGRIFYAIAWNVKLIATATGGAKSCNQTARGCNSRFSRSAANGSQVSETDMHPKVV